MLKPTIAVTGSTGFVGTHLTKFLHEKNIPIISLVRKNHNRISEKNITFTDLEKISKIECDVLVHLIGTGSQTIDSDYELVNVQQTQKAVYLCKKFKIKKIIYVSGLGVSNSTTLGYFISKLKAENLIRNSGLDYTIFRASYIVGPDDPLTQNLDKQIRNGQLIIPGSGKYRLQPISIDDVCKIILIASINKKLSNKTIDLVGPKTISFENYVKKFNKSRSQIKKISLEQALHAALNNPQKALYGVDDLSIMVGDFVSDHKKLEKLTGLKLKIPIL